MQLWNCLNFTSFRITRRAGNKTNKIPCQHFIIITWPCIPGSLAFTRERKSLVVQWQAWCHLRTQMQTVSIAPAEGQKPLSIMTDRKFEAMVNPDKFCFGNGTFNKKYLKE